MSLRQSKQSIQTIIISMSLSKQLYDKSNDNNFKCIMKLVLLQSPVQFNHLTNKTKKSSLVVLKILIIKLIKLENRNNYCNIV
jgi:hypothetical protein